MTDDVNLSNFIEKIVLSFDGVSRFPDFGFTESLQNMIIREKVYSGVKITEEEDESITVNCGIIAYFGVNIPQLCYDIQTKVKHEIEEVTGISVKAINIRVEGIDEMP